MPIYKNNEKQHDGSQLMQHQSVMSHDALDHLISDPENLFIYSYLIEGSNHLLILLLVLPFTNF